MKLSYRVVAFVSGNSEAVVLRGLLSDTQYQVTVTAIWSGKKYRSRPIQFRTLGELEEGERLMFLHDMSHRPYQLFANHIIKLSTFVWTSSRVTSYIATTRLSNVNGRQRCERRSTPNRYSIQRYKSFS